MAQFSYVLFQEGLRFSFLCLRRGALCLKRELLRLHFFLFDSARVMKRLWPSPRSKRSNYKVTSKSIAADNKLKNKQPPVELSSELSITSN
ncbi:hypothetical protein HN51_054369 [Arachis hypogaea]